MGTVILDIILLTVMASLPVAPNAEELAASTTLQAIGGLWIPTGGFNCSLLRCIFFKRDIYLGVDAAESADLDNGEQAPLRWSR